MYYKRQRIVYLFDKDNKPPSIARLLRKKDLSASRRGIAKFLAKYLATGSIGRRPTLGRPSKVTAEDKTIVDDKMTVDDETSTYPIAAFSRVQHFVANDSTMQNVPRLDISR